MKYLVLFIVSISAFSSIYKIIDDPKDAISIRYSLLKSAKQEIFSSKYIFHKDFAAYTSLALLRQKSVEIHDNNLEPDIRLLVDRFGKFFKHTPLEVLLHLKRDHGIEFKFYNDLLSKKVITKKIIEGYDPVLALLTLPIALFLPPISPKPYIKVVEHRLHDKLFIVDGEYMVTGGRNIQDPYFDKSESTYVDRDVFTNGKAASDSREHFLKFWNNPASTYPEYSKRYCRKNYKKEYYKNNRIFGNTEDCLEAMRLKGKAILDEHFDKIEPQFKTFKIDENFHHKIVAEEEDDETVEFVGDKLDEKGNYISVMSKRLVEIANNAKDKIVIENAYFVPTPTLLSILDKKLHEGIKITILTNSLSSTDNNEAYSGYFKFRPILMKLGPINNKIKLYEYQGDAMGSNYGNAIHSKSATIDDEYSIIGSYNLDQLSEYYNTEVALISRNPKKAIELRESIESHINYSYQVGIDGVPCNPNVCAFTTDKHGNLLNGAQLHPNASPEKISWVNRYMKVLDKDNFLSKWILKHL